MISLRFQFGCRMRAGIALLVLLFTVLAPPVKLLLPAPVTCGMACCVESGVCYCLPAAIDSEAHGHPNAEVATASATNMAAAQLGPGCPAQCAQLPVGYRDLTLAKVRPTEFLFLVNAAQLLYAYTPHFARDALLDPASAPRAPPTALLKLSHTFFVLTP